jgi:GTP cyclohydrolase I
MNNAAVKNEISAFPHVSALFDKVDDKSDVIAAAVRPSFEEAEEAVRVLLRYIDPNPGREGLQDTPKRVVKSYAELFSGYAMDPAALLSTTFKDVSDYDDLVMVGATPFESHCEHHKVPFVGKAWIAYYPKDGVVGLSKFSRLVDGFARRLQTQETMTAQIGQAIDAYVEPEGTAVLIEAEHMCVCMRGIGKHGSSTVTRYFSGKFKDPAEKSGFMDMCKGYL